MMMKPRTSLAQPWVDFFVHSLPGGGKSAFVLSSYWEKDGKRGGPVVFDFDKRGVDATAADMGLAGKFPIFEPTCEEDIIYSCTYWEDIIAEVHKMDGFQDYEVSCLSWDTITSMEDMIMGESPRATSERLKADPGSGLLTISRKRDATREPAPGDYKALGSRTKAFVRRVRAIPMHTIVTAHTHRTETQDSKKGLGVRDEDKNYGFFPGLIGQNRYTAAKFHDFYLYLFQRGGNFFAYTRTQGGIECRTRYQNHIKPEIANPKFWDFVQIHENLRLTTDA
jgi:hypothetical protein